MTEISYKTLRDRLPSILDRVANDHETLIVRRRDGKKVAIIRAQDVAGLEETAHLLRSPKNARRLLSALRRALAGKDRPETLAHFRSQLLR